MLIGGLEAGLLASAFKDRWTQIDENEGQMIRHISPGTQMTKAEFVSAMLNGSKNYFPLTGTFTPYILILVIAYLLIQNRLYHHPTITSFLNLLSYDHLLVYLHYLLLILLDFMQLHLIHLIHHLLIHLLLMTKHLLYLIFLLQLYLFMNYQNFFLIFHLLFII